MLLESKSIESIMKSITEVHKIIESFKTKIAAVTEVINYKYEKRWRVETAAFVFLEKRLSTPAANIIKEFKFSGELVDPKDVLNFDISIKDIPKGYDELLAFCTVTYKRCLAWEVMMDGMFNDKVLHLFKSYGLNLLTAGHNMERVWASLKSKSQTSRLDKIKEEHRKLCEHLSTIDAAYDIEPVLHLSTLNFRDSAIVTEACLRSALTDWFPADSTTELLYRSSRDGASAFAFHSKCDMRGPTVTLIKSSSGYILGGYNDRGASSFIFTLRNPHGTMPTKFGIRDDFYAIYNHKSYGPTFGAFERNVSVATISGGAESSVDAWELETALVKLYKELDSTKISNCAKVAGNFKDKVPILVKSLTEKYPESRSLILSTMKPFLFDDGSVSKSEKTPTVPVPASKASGAKSSTVLKTNASSTPYGFGVTETVGQHDICITFSSNSIGSRFGTPIADVIIGFPNSYGPDTTGKGRDLFAGAHSFYLGEVEVYQVTSL
jgi:hypothetical protein